MFKISSYFATILALVFLPFACLATAASCDLIQPISLKENQNIFRFVSGKTANTQVISSSKQKQYLNNFFENFFSPWQNKKISLLHKGASKSRYYEKLELGIIRGYKHNLGYGENYQPHSTSWLNRIVGNMDMLHFPNADRNAITVDNTLLRVLPTISPHYNNFRKAGEGYPLDNLQESAILAGIPLHVFQTSKDGDWIFVQTPDVAGWVQIKDIAYVNDDFIQHWKTKNYVATIVKDYPLKDTSGVFRFHAYLGSVFPYIEESKDSYRIEIPAANINRQAVIVEANVSKKVMRKMPLLATPNNIASAINQLLDEPYGWGGLYFYTDCSSALKNILAPFGIWLPRNSSAQAKAGEQIISLNKLSPGRRQNYILEHGIPFVTLLYVPGHIMLYIGEENGRVMTFQNLWAFQTWGKRNGDWCEGRAIVGKALLMPLELDYDRGMTPQIAVDDLEMTFL